MMVMLALVLEPEVLSMLLVLCSQAGVRAGIV